MTKLALFLILIAWATPAVDRESIVGDTRAQRRDVLSLVFSRGALITVQDCRRV